MRALVTGGGKRIGRAMAIYLAERGYDVAIHFHNSLAEAEETASLVRDAGQSSVILKADLLEDDASAGLIARASDALGGPIAVLINNASIFEYDTLASATSESWDRHIGSNLRAPFLLSQAFAAQGLDAKRDANAEPVAQGLIVNMIDQRVRKLTPEFMTYTLSKMGLWALTQTTAQALAPATRVNAIGPGPTVQGARQSAAHFATQRQKTILERGSDPSDICEALGYLLTAKSVTGQLICVDGGQHLAWQTPDVLGVE